MFVHFDGPHMTRDVLIRICLVCGARAASGCRFVFDDYPKYNMQLISDALKPLDSKYWNKVRTKYA